MKKLYLVTALMIVASIILAACGGNAATATQAPAATQAMTEAPTQAMTEAPTQAMTEAPTQAATQAPSGQAPDCTKTDVFCVGFVTDVGKIDDKSFNQTAWEGVEKAKTDGDADWVQYIETTDSKDYDKNI